MCLNEFWMTLQKVHLSPLFLLLVKVKPEQLCRLVSGMPLLLIPTTQHKVRAAPFSQTGQKHWEVWIKK